MGDDGVRVDPCLVGGMTHAQPPAQLARPQFARIDRAHDRVVADVRKLGDLSRRQQAILLARTACPGSR